MAEDFIMRLVQQVAAMLAAILTQRRSGQIAEARQEVGKLCLESIGLPVEKVKQMTPEGVASHLRESGGNQYPRAVLLAELLLQDAEILESQGALQDALPSYVHAFCLLADAYPVLATEEQAVYRVKLDDLVAKLEQLPANPYTTGRIRVYRDRG
jgi:hypothetical protein